MSSISTKLDAIIGKMNTILDDYINLEEEYLKLLEDRDIIKQKLTQQQTNIHELEEQLRYLKLSKSANLSVDDKSEVKASINGMLKEIDRCIAMLNN